MCIFVVRMQIVFHRVPRSVATGQRDTQRMERFSCRSYLAFKPSLEGRTLDITLRHRYHAPYMDRKLSLEAMECVRARNSFSTPAEIYRDLQAAQPCGWEFATAQQVYYQWQQANSSIWRRDPYHTRFEGRFIEDRTEVQAVEGGSVMVFDVNNL
ncbi:hypothetical protein V1509DRAFT_228318 [Lipomyces kononenkoae]